MTKISVATWNVNGIRARHAELGAWIDRERPDVVCLQEIKATPDQIPPLLGEMEGYWSCWHGGKGYSGVGLMIRQELALDRPRFFHPEFDYEHRVVAAEVAGLTVVSVYVPNGGKDFGAKVGFLRAMESYATSALAGAGALVLCGDMNVTLTERDVHPKERKPRAIGQLPEERELLAHLLSRGLTDVGRALDPENDQLFTWWAPWRQLRARNIGWRLDYVLASASLASRALSCVVQRDVGTSDHAPVVATFAL